MAGFDDPSDEQELKLQKVIEGGWRLDQKVEEKVKQLQRQPSQPLQKQESLLNKIVHENWEVDQRTEQMFKKMSLPPLKLDHRYSRKLSSGLPYNNTGCLSFFVQGNLTYTNTGHNVNVSGTQTNGAVKYE